MSPRVRTQHGEVNAELAWSGSGSRSEITPAVGRTVHLPPPPLPIIRCLSSKTRNKTQRYGVLVFFIMLFVCLGGCFMTFLYTF
ncbi:hypothetical protein Hanom_Chr00s188878g01834191 [Helianthus anomalus]